MSRPIGAKEWGAAFALALVTVGGLLGVAYSSGAIHAAYQDDWAFSRLAFHFYETGDIQLIGWGPMTLVGHLLWAVPFMAVFGPSLEVLHWATAVAAAIALLAAFAVLRRFLAPRPALFGTALVAILPAYGIYASSYMTDMTAFAAEMTCLALGLAALDAEGRRRWMLLGASLAVGMFGFAVREIAISAPIGVLAGHLLAARRRGTPWRYLLWPPVALFACAQGFLSWRHGLAGNATPDHIPGPSTMSIFVFGQGYFTLALGLLPALVTGVGKLWGGRFARGSLAATGACLTLAALVLARQARHDDPAELPLGDHFGRSWKRESKTAPADSPPDFLPDAVWAAIDVLALLAGVLLLAWLVGAALDALVPSRVRSIDASAVVLVVFAVLYVAALTYNAAVGGSLYERYFPPLTVALLIIPLRALGSMRPVRGALLPLVTAGGMTVLAVVTVIHETALRGAEWKVGEQAVAGGASPRAVDAGFAWAGYHANGRVHVASRSPRWQEPRPFYARYFPGSGNCLSTSSVALSDRRLELVRTHEFRWIPGLGKRKIWLYRNAEACRRSDSESGSLARGNLGEYGSRPRLCAKHLEGDEGEGHEDCWSVHGGGVGTRPGRLR
jgi:hypothetical protein